MMLTPMAAASAVSVVATSTTEATTGATPPASGVQATATLTAAIIAAVVALVVAVISVINTSRSLKQSRRDQWWQQFQWAIEKALSPDQDESDVGSAVMDQLVKRKEATVADNEIALTVADMLVEREELTVADSLPERNKRTWKIWSRHTKPSPEGQGRGSDE
jgi:type II secretory pathway component PulL